MRWPPSLNTNVRIPCVFEYGEVGNISDIDYIHDRLHETSLDRPGTPRLQSLQDCTVVKVELCKTADGEGQGEFVLVTVHHPDNVKYPRVLRFERCAERIKPDDEDGQVVGVDGDVIWDTVGYYKTARDALQKRFQAPQAQKGYSCWTLTFKEGQNPNALDLFSAAIVLRRAGQHDTSIVPMNYWYAHNLFRLLAYGREHMVDTTHSIWAPTPGYLFGLPIIDSLGKIKERPQEISLEEFTARKAEKRTLFETLVSNFAPSEDVTTSEFSFSPGSGGSSTFIPSDDIVEYHKRLLVSRAETERRIPRFIVTGTPPHNVKRMMERLVAMKMRKTRWERIEVEERTETVLENIAIYEEGIRELEASLLEALARMHASRF